MIRISQPAATFQENMRASQTRCFDCGDFVESFWGTDDNELVCGECFQIRKIQLQRYLALTKNRQGLQDRSAPDEPMTQRERHAYWLLAYAVFVGIVWLGWLFGPTVLQFWERITR
jgi:hypothetical protein